MKDELKRTLSEAAKEFNDGSFDPETIIRSLLLERIITPNERDLVKHERTRPARLDKLFLEILPSKDDIAFDVFVKILDGHQIHSVVLHLPMFPNDAKGNAAKVKKNQQGQEDKQNVTNLNREFANKAHENNQILPKLYESDKQVLFDKNDLIGEGAYAKVYSGKYGDLRVAIKKFKNYDEKWLKECDLLKKLNHKNVVSFIDFVIVKEKSQMLLITELVEGGAMTRFCNPNNVLSRSAKIRISISCWSGLHYLHSEGVCHKDISPNNILISDDLTTVKIADFGLSELKEGYLMSKTYETQGKGTVTYNPPELYSNIPMKRSLRSPKNSDVYSMGASLCEFFSGESFWGKELNSYQVSMLLAKQRKHIEKFNEIRDGAEKEPSCWKRVPTDIQNVLIEAIHPDYKKRKAAYEMVLSFKMLL